MKLQTKPFDQIKSGTKTIEIRLNDEKRQMLRVGDAIEFSLMSDPVQTIRTKVIDLEKFSAFRELFTAYPAKEYGAENQDEWELMYKYYSREDETKYGVIAVRVKG